MAGHHDEVRTRHAPELAAYEPDASRVGSRAIQQPLQAVQPRTRTACTASAMCTAMVVVSSPTMTPG